MTQVAVKTRAVYISRSTRAPAEGPSSPKATGAPVAKIAAASMAGEKLAGFRARQGAAGGHVAVKEAGFPSTGPGRDVILAGR